MKKPIIVFGSARSHGNTREAVEEVQSLISSYITVIDLLKHSVKPFSYEYNQNDDFADLIEAVLTSDIIILATPIYWYGPSAQMKCFIDRLTNLLTVKKDLGRKMRGKTLTTIASYNTYPEGTHGFEMIMKQIATYLGMDYIPGYLKYAGEDLKGKSQSKALLNQFTQNLAAALN
jgi:multimeric flavodoxin WrbA